MVCSFLLRVSCLVRVLRFVLFVVCRFVVRRSLFVVCSLTCVVGGLDCCCSLLSSWFVV